MTQHPPDGGRRTANRYQLRPDRAHELLHLVRKIETYEGSPKMRLMLLTFGRTSELIEALWEEFEPHR